MASIRFSIPDGLYCRSLGHERCVMQSLLGGIEYCPIFGRALHGISLTTGQGKVDTHIKCIPCREAMEDNDESKALYGLIGGVNTGCLP